MRIPNTTTGMQAGLLSTAAATFLLAGCASTVETHRTAQERFDESESRARGAIQEQVERDKNRAREALENPKVVDQPYVNVERVPVEDHLPSFFDEHVTLNQPRPTSIDVVMDKLSSSTGVHMSYENDLVDKGYGSEEDEEDEDSSEVSADSTEEAEEAVGPPDIVVPGEGDEGQGETLSRKPKIQVSVSGPLDEVLDSVAHVLDASWRYDEAKDRVVFYRFQTRTFDLSHMPGSKKGEMSLSAGEGSGGASSELSYSSDHSPWGEVRSSLEAMLSSQGRYSVSESIGKIVVRDYPDIMARVKEYLDLVNETVGRQVSIRVQIYKVSSNADDKRGVNWDVLFDNSDHLKSSLVSNLNPQDSMSGLSRLIFERQGGHYDASQMIIESLNRMGDVSRLTSTVAQTTSGEAVPVRVSKTTRYLEEVETSSTADTGSTSTSLTPGEIETGMNMQLVPVVKPNGRDLQMQIVLSLSTLDEIREFSSGESTIQLPETSSRDFMQRAWLSSGQTLVLSGFESVDSAMDQSGMVDASIWPFGGSKEAATKRESIVVLITPVVSSIDDGML